MIKLEDISVTFGLGTALEKTALQKVNLEIDSGDFITLIGSNGAGKSTMLNLLAGELIPDQGKIFFANEDVSHQSLELRAKLISRVFQDPRNGVCEEFTLEENLALAIKRGKRRGFSLAVGKTQRNYFKSLLTEAGVGLENRLTDRVANLSGGQRQALSLIMATLIPSQLLLLDEHTAALDPKMEKVILALTQRLIKKHQLTTVMITHSMNQALEMGNRTLIMQQGTILSDLVGEKRAKLTPVDLVAFF